MKIRRISEAELTLRKLEANVFFQIVRDLCVEMYNYPCVKKCRTDYLSITCLFEKFDKKSSRRLGKGMYEEGQNLIAFITDSVQDDIEECKNEIKGCIEGIVVEEKIDFASTIGMVSGFIDCIQQIYTYLKGSGSQDIAMVVTYLKHTEKTVRIEAVKCAGEPDFSKMQEPMVKLFRTIGERCKETINTKQ